MEAMQAVVLTECQLREMLEEAGKHAAQLVADNLRSELRQGPDERNLDLLRAYIEDPAAVSNPNEHWAHSGIIREIRLTPRGKPKSVAWFMKFQRETGLRDCRTRKSPVHGRRREWSFADIRLAWHVYYGEPFKNQLTQ